MKKGDRVKIIRIDGNYKGEAKVGMTGTIVEETDNLYKYWVEVEEPFIMLGFKEEELALIEKGGEWDEKR